MSGLSVFLHVCVGSLVAAGGYQFGRDYLGSFGGEWTGLALGMGALFAAISAGNAQARQDGYRQGHYDGRNGLFDRTDEIR